MVIDDLTYYGSTTSALATRRSNHKSDFKRYTDNTGNYCSSFKLFALGIPDIVLVESFKCENKEELHARERYYIDNFECVNKNRPSRTKDEKLIYDREFSKDYYKIHKDEIKECRKSQYKTRKEYLMDEANIII